MEGAELVLYRLGYGNDPGKEPLPKGADPETFLANLQNQGSGEPAPKKAKGKKKKAK
jgi:hypothetical protein